MIIIILVFDKICVNCYVKSRVLKHGYVGFIGRNVPVSGPH